METSREQENALRKNDSIKVELYKIALNNGEDIFLTNDNTPVEWGGDEYLPCPGPHGTKGIQRGPSNQNQGQGVNQVSITIGDDFTLTRLILNDIKVILKASVIVYQQITNTDGIGIVFRQIFKGVIINPSGQTGLINFTVIEPYHDFSKPVNRRKLGELPGVIDVSNKLF